MLRQRAVPAVNCLRAVNSFSGTLSLKGKFMGDSGLSQAIRRRYARPYAGSRRLRASESRESPARYLHQAFEERDRAVAPARQRLVQCQFTQANARIPDGEPNGIAEICSRHSGLPCLQDARGAAERRVGPEMRLLPPGL